MLNIKRQQSIFDQTFSQRATTTADSRRTYKVPKQAIDFKNKFETYLSGQSSCIDIIKFNNILPTKKYKHSNLTKRKTVYIGNTISKQEPMIDYNDIKQFITEYDKNYTEINKSLKTQPCLTERKSTKEGLRTYIKSDYQENKRLNHFHLIAEDYRSQIKNNNLISTSNQQLFKNKIKARTKQIALIRPQIDSGEIQSRIKQLKQENGSKQPIVEVYQKLFRATSDHFMESLKLKCNIQNSELQKLGELDFYDVDNKDKIELEKQLRKSKSQIKIKVLKRNKNCPTNQIDDCVLDESIISETEAKLTTFYGLSKDFQKKVLNKNENPNKVINFITKIDQIREGILRVNKNKLYTK